MHKVVGEEKDLFTIEIKLTSKCNYDCYYCTCNPDIGMPGHNNKHKICTFDVDNICTLITQAKKKLDRRINVFIFGGEPTLHKDMISMINDINRVLDPEDEINILSNLSKPIQWFVNMVLEIERLDNVYVSGSYHNTYTNSTTFLSKCMFLKSRGILGMVTVMLNKTDLDGIVCDYNKFKRHLGEEYCEVSLITTVNNIPGKRELDLIYSKFGSAERKAFKGTFKEDILVEEASGKSYYTSKADIWHKAENHYSGYTCSVGRDKINIDWNGDCYSCCNDYYSTKPPLFNINECSQEVIETHFTNINDVVCPYQTCVFDIEYKKSKPVNLTIPGISLNNLDA